MIYIKYIGKIKNKNGTSSSWGWFFCEFCETYVKKRLDLGKKCKSCGCQKYSDERNIKISIKNSGQKRDPLTEEHKQKISNGNKGKRHLHTEETKQKIREARANQIFSEETRQKMSKAAKGENNPMYGKFGELSGNWLNGKSFETYSSEFKQIKKFILERDNYICQNPNCNGNHKKLHIHHIDYDKKNNNPKNLITLCAKCHTKTNGKNNREYWINYYQNIILTIIDKVVY